MSRASPSRRTFGLLVVALGVAAAGCRRREEQKPVRASFGVFFGGQIQEREELPLILDRARQSMGIRVEFAEPPDTAQELSWELEKPGAGKDGGAGTADYGKARTRPGQPTLDIPLAFRTGDRVGNWRIKVMLGDEPLLDRKFRVVAATSAPASEE